MKRELTRRWGFTLLELLSVMSMIAILAAILFPVFARAREATRTHACQANLHQIGLALHMYARDYDGNLPQQPNDLAPLASPYINGLSILTCPSDANPLWPDRSATSVTYGFPPINPGLVPVPSGPIYGSYQYRGHLTEDDPGDTPVAADWSFLHTDHANVLTLSGEVRPTGPAQWVPLAPGPRPHAPVSELKPSMKFLPSPQKGPRKNPARPKGERE